MKMTAIFTVGVGLAALCQLPAIASAAPSTRYVTTSGSDTGNNCLAIVAPCRTVTYALFQANPGDTVSIGAGVFIESKTLFISTPVILRGASNDATVVQVSTDSVVYIVEGTNVVIRDLTISGGRTEWYGGGIYNGGGLLLESVVVSDNEAQVGAGIYNAPGASLTMRNSTVSSNSAIAWGLPSGAAGGLADDHGRHGLLRAPREGSAREGSAR